MGCGPLSDTAAWESLVNVNIDLRACLRLLTNRMQLDIPNVDLTLPFELEGALQTILNLSQFRLGQINQELGCIQIVISGMDLSVADFASFAKTLGDRAIGLLRERNELEQTINRLPSQLAQAVAQREELSCLRQNTSFLDQILGGIT